MEQPLNRQLQSPLAIKVYRSRREQTSRTIFIGWRDKDGNWNVLKSTVDTVNKTVSAQIDHLPRLAW